MANFRKSVPIYTLNRRVCINYRSYKNTLRKDFNNRCGYCDSIDLNRIRDFVIDHFIPRNPNGWTHAIAPNNYYNLIYSCSFCNGAKSNKWPTKNVRIENNGRVGFIKPTKTKYGNLFRRGTNGKILVHNNSVIGNYIYKELDFILPIRALNWKFEKFLLQEERLKKLYKTVATPQLQNQIDQLTIQRTKISDIINGIYNS